MEELRKTSPEKYIISPDATHVDIVRNVLDAIAQGKTIILSGESRGGKSYFLSHTLLSAMEQNDMGAVYINCFMGDDATRTLLETQAIPILDEPFRNQGDDNFVQGLRRIISERPVIICNPAFSSPEGSMVVSSFSETIGLDQSKIVTIDFPLYTSREDAIKVINNVISKLGDLPSETRKIYCDTLSKLTTNPKLLADIYFALYHEGLSATTSQDINDGVKNLILSDKLYFGESLKNEKERLSKVLGI